MTRAYLIYGILTLLLATYGSLQGWSYWSYMKTGRWVASGPKAYHK